MHRRRIWECGRAAATLPLIFHVLIEQFFVNKYKDIILKCSESFSNIYEMEDLTIATQLESVLSCIA